LAALGNGRSGLRERVSLWFERAGIHSILGSLPKQKILLVLNYHRIGHSERWPYDPDIFSATPEELDDHVQFLKGQMEFTDLAGAIELVEGKRPWKEAAALLTFDDGYRDSYDEAFPILRRHNVQGVFFLPTSFVGTNRLPWWDTVAYIVRNSRTPVLRLDYPSPRELDFRPPQFDTSLRLLLRAYKQSAVDSERFLCALEEAAGVSRPSGHQARVFLNWEEARQMHEGGMAIGSHAHSHEILSTLPGDEQLSELKESRELIAQSTGAPVESLAYPVGKRTSFSQATQRAAEEAGYRAAFSFYGGVNLPERTERYDIQRCGVDRPLRERLRLQILNGAVFRKFWP
jgi:peptidoglycan/xylan/chitin deacetylase (PgdA/CDA1 family)